MMTTSRGLSTVVTIPRVPLSLCTGITLPFFLTLTTCANPSTKANGLSCCGTCHLGYPPDRNSISSPHTTRACRPPVTIIFVIGLIILQQEKRYDVRALPNTINTSAPDPRQCPGSPQRTHQNFPRERKTCSPYLVTNAMTKADRLRRRSWVRPRVAL